MKSREVLNRYANGERDFRRADLRGQNFKGQDLSGADFSETDIRGANFSNANLQGANFTAANIQGTNFTNAILKGSNFTEAEAGLQRRWMVSQLMVALAMSALSGLLLGFTGILTTYFLINQKYTILLGIPTLMALAVMFIAIIRHGFVVEAFGTLAINLFVAFTLTFVLIFAINGIVAGTFALVIICAIVGVVIAAFASAFAGGLGKTALPIAIIFALTIAIATAASQIFVNLTISAIALAISIATATLLLGSYMALCTLQSDRKYFLVRKFSVSFNAQGGTRFYKADLTETNFTKATLRAYPKTLRMGEASRKEI